MNKKGVVKVILALIMVALVTMGGYFAWSKKYTSPSTPKCVDSSQPPNVFFNDYRGEFVYTCNREVNLKENKCVKETFNLESGEKLSAQEGPCAIY